MNRSESNPLQRELARSQHGEPHPDAGMLTAFSEGTLMQRERQQVLAHLAVCAECREVMSLGAAAAADLQPVAVPRRSLAPVRAWLPWASVAAGLLVVCSAGLLYQQKHAFRKNTEVATKEAVQLPSSTLRQLPPPPPELRKTLSRTDNSSASKQLPTPSPSRNMTGANAVVEGHDESVKQSDMGQQNSYQMRSAEGGGMASNISAQQAAPTQSISAFVHAESTPVLSKAPLAAAARPHWRINTMGRAERSFGDGAWQAVLPYEASRMRVVSVFNGEVWIGGENSRLYHSCDNGSTWKLVALPDKNGRAHSIAHVHFLTAQSGTVESEDGTVWTTSDGGATWR